jgi:alpha-beta hydrolase superfamily lysophospholipase
MTLRLLYKIVLTQVGFLMLPGVVWATEFDLYPAKNSYKVSPGVVLLQGANVDKADYSEFAVRLSRSGFHVIVPNVLRKIAGVAEPGLFASQDVVNEAFAQLKIENATPSSRLYRRVDLKKYAVVGHSFGGMVALFSVDGHCLPPLCVNSYVKDPELRAAVVLGTSIFWQGREVAIDNHATPVALISGYLDGFATPDLEKQSYDRLSSPKAWLAIKGANHYAMTNRNAPSGARPDRQQQTLSQSRSIDVAAMWTARFLRATLQSDLVARARVRAAAISMPRSLAAARVSLEGI